MSGSVQAEDPLETTGHARRPPDRCQPPADPAGLASSGLTGSILTAAAPAPSTAHESALQRVIATPADNLPRQPFQAFDPFASRAPITFSGHGPTHSSASAYPPIPFGASSPGTSSRTLPQKPTRRTKAHVASACVNCKKKHLGCDPARPCRRCVLSGKESTCVDVTHKKRGRPPLKAEETSLRTYAPQMDNAPAGHHGPQTRRTHMHRATSSREIRPVTDLQIPGGPMGSMGSRTAAAPPHRWAPGMYPHVVDPALTMQRNMGHRRFSSSGSAHSFTAPSPPAFVPMAGGGYSPALTQGRMPAGVGRPLSSYGTPSLQPSTSPPQYPQPYSVPMSPYAEPARMTNRLSMGEPPMQRDPRESYLESPVRLPPIYPPTMTHPSPGSQGHSHRLSDPYQPVWSSPHSREELFHHHHHHHHHYQPHQHHHQEPEQRQAPPPPPPPPGIMDPISPQSQMRQAAADLGYGESTVPRPMEPMPSTTTPRHSVDLSSGRARDEPPSGDADRPAKRRKMALDDMVND